MAENVNMTFVNCLYFFFYRSSHLRTIFTNLSNRRIRGVSEKYSNIHLRIHRELEERDFPLFEIYENMSKICGAFKIRRGSDIYTYTADPGECVSFSATIFSSGATLDI